jgi:hypothetical protein
VLKFVVLLDDGSIHYSLHVRIDERPLVAGGHTPFSSAERDLPNDSEGDPSGSYSGTEAYPTPPARHRELHINALPPRAPSSAALSTRASPNPRVPPRSPIREQLYPLLDEDNDPVTARDDDPTSTPSDDYEATTDDEFTPHYSILSPDTAPTYPATMPATTVSSFPTSVIPASDLRPHEA